MSDTKAFFVAIYETDRAYGGPEEGGWWFDCGVPSEDPECLLLCRVFSEPEAASEYVDSLRDKLAQLNEEHNKRPAWSVACNGYYEAFVTEGLPTAYPEEIPRYE